MKYIKIPIMTDKEHTDWCMKYYQKCLETKGDPIYALPEKPDSFMLIGWNIGEATIMTGKRGNKKEIKVKCTVSPKSSWIKFTFFDKNNNNEVIESYWIPLWLFDPTNIGNDIFKTTYNDKRIELYQDEEPNEKPPTNKVTRRMECE